MLPSVTSTFCTKSLDCQLVDEQTKADILACPYHYAVLYIDETPIPNAGYQTPMPAPRWPSFHFNISSAVKIAIYRKRWLSKDALVAQYTGHGHDFLDRDTKYDLTDETGSPMDLCLSVNVDLLPQSPDHNSARREQTFVSIGTSGKVINVGGHFINGDYNVYQGPTHSVIHTGARVRGTRDVQKEADIEKWMNAPDTSPNFNAARKKHTPDTGSWFLDGPEFARWKEDPDFLLWLHGGPGCGKTVLCAAAIQQIIDFCKSKTSTGYAYFFFDGRSAEAALLLHEKFVRSIVIQLSRRYDGIPAALAEMYENCDWGLCQPSIELLDATLLRILDSFDDIYIIIDSLDECCERREVVQWIQSIASRASGKVHMAVSSRPEPEIMQGLRALSQLKEICISAHQTEPDIRSYLNTRLSQRDAAKWKKAQTDMIMEVLMDGADGMFRWVALQADHLMKCASPRELEMQLRSLPRDLHESYSRYLVESHDPGNLKRLLQWLAYSRRAMTIEEISEVAVIDFGDADSLPVYDAGRRFADPDHVLSLCYGLVAEVEVTFSSEAEGTPILKRGVKLAHLSVKEYLISEHILSGAAANFHVDEQLSQSMIAQTSLAYLLHFDKPEFLPEDIPPSFPLARYAAKHWAAHCHSAGSDQGNAAALQQLQLHFFKPSPSYAMCNWLFLRSWGLARLVGRDRKAEDLVSSLYYACESGSKGAVANLITNGADINSAGEYRGIPLLVACSAGYLAIVQLLLAHGADVNAVDTVGQWATALQIVSARGHLEIAQLLLAHGANGTAALVAASGAGHLPIVQLLLAHGANVYAESTCGEFDAALEVASKNGHLAIVQLLLAHGADAKATGEQCRDSALQTASSHGHLAIVQLLLAHGANVNAESTWGGTALMEASGNGHLTIVQLLLAHGADVIPLGTQEPALVAASRAGHIPIIELILTHSTNINIEAQSNVEQSAMSAAASGGHSAIIKLLQEHGARAG